MKYNLDYFLLKSWSFALIKDKKIVFKSKAQGLSPLVFCLKNFKGEMEGAVAYDKIIGQAAAIFLAYGKVKEIWTPVIGEGGLKYLHKNKIKVIYKSKVKNILNKKGDDLCPMEKLSKEKGLPGLAERFKI